MIRPAFAYNPVEICIFPLWVLYMFMSDFAYIPFGFYILSCRILHISLLDFIYCHVRDILN